MCPVAWLSSCLPICAAEACCCCLPAGLLLSCAYFLLSLTVAICDPALLCVLPGLCGIADILADPIGAGGLWDRFEVAWQGEVPPPDVLARCLAAAC